MKYLYLVPEELRNAKKVNDSLASVATTSKSNRAYLLWNLSIFMVGAGLGGYFSKFVDDGFLNAIITFDGVIIGFVITAMLFSGRSQFVSRMTVEQTKIYSARTKYMLMSQINTLFAFLCCLGFSLLALLAAKTDLMLDRTVLVGMVSGYFVLGCYRMMLLPFQIYDIHAFALDNLVQDSVDDARGAAKSATETRLKMLGK